MQVVRIFSMSRSLFFLARKFSTDSLDERSFEKILEEIKLSFEDAENNPLWGVVVEDKIVGYMLAAYAEVHGSPSVLIEQVFVEPGTPREVWNLLHEAIDQYGRLSGCRSLYFSTHRNLKPFLRLLGRSWKLDSYVLRRDILLK